MTQRPASASEASLVSRSVARLRAAVMAIVFATVCGLGLAVATLWLLLQGGPGVGSHLSLLGNYFPGYRVDGRGVLLGLAYGALFGALLGWVTAWIYNTIATIRDR